MENKIALISLILGILAYIPILGFILAPIAIVCGIFGTRKEEGKTLAFSGILLGIIALIFNIIFFIFVIIPFILGFALAATGTAICESCSQSGT